MLLLVSLTQLSCDLHIDNVLLRRYETFQPRSAHSPLCICSFDCIGGYPSNAYLQLSGDFQSRKHASVRRSDLAALARGFRVVA
ncbi:hypothetical protein C8Q74DRAFT_1278639 [Fomes fomentarius]|nr:hypothetical protein C8Q74DRAFT_1278639 [Fomes fomentarius]